MTYLPWILVLVFLGILAESTKSWALGSLFYMVLVVFIFAIRSIYRPSRLLDTRRRLTNSVVAVGQTTRVEVSLNWDRPIGMRWLMVHDTLPESCHTQSPCGHLFVAGTDTSTSFSYRVSGLKRGYYCIGPLTISTGDFFGLTQTQFQQDDQQYLTVYPKVVPVPPLRIASNRPLGEATSRKRIFEDPSRLLGVRDYTPGDPFSRIHWKTTARTGRLATKMCESSTSVEVNILLDLYYGDYPQREDEVELAFSTAASITSFLLLNKHVVGLQSNGYDGAWRHSQSPPQEALCIKADKGEQQHIKIMSALGRLEVASSPSLQEYLTQIHSTLPWTSTTLLITHFMTEECILALEAFKRSGFELAVVIVGEGQYAEITRDRVAQVGIPVAMAPSEKALAYLEFWQPGRG
ncbi:MAG TPA: DUF58 domain-containing protein [Armatimonadota bacterium]|nr:DUF58 domain-containing protein [Armatimonadota bacterium]